MKLVRKLHLWMGMLFAPSILFFALSGAFQVCGLHEGDGPAWIARLALVHKDQLLSAPSRTPRPAEAAPKPDAPKPEAARPVAPPRERPHPSQPLKAFFFLMALGLMASTGLGIYLAYGYKRDRVTVLGLLAAGTLIPIVTLFL
jgi:hypothetical protein